MTAYVLEDRFVGSMLGTALGDALGAPFEGRARVTVPEVENLIAGRGQLRYTDDTHMSIGLAQSLVARRGLDEDHLAQTLAENHGLEPWRGYGEGSARVFRLIRSGVHWREAAVQVNPGGSYGNGGAIRVAPLGLFYFDRLRELELAAERQSAVTHANSLGKEGAVLQAAAVAYALRSDPRKPVDISQFLGYLGSLARSKVYREKLRSLKDLVEQSCPWQSELAHRGNQGVEMEQEMARVRAALGNGVTAHDSVVTALYFFLTSPDAFLPGIIRAISLGGDTDSIAAMTGAITGARLGRGAIPPELEGRLENHSLIEEMGTRLYEIKAGF